MAYSKDCGKWPRVSPCSASSASASGPRRPGSRVAVIESWSTASSRFIRIRSRETTPAKPVAAGDQAAGRPRCRRRTGPRATWCSTAPARGRRRPRRGVPGRTTASGASLRSPARSRSRSGVDLPRVRSRRVSSSVSTCSAPSDAAPARRAASSVERLGEADVGGVDGRRLVECRRRHLDQAASALSGSGAAWAGSPQRDGCISGCCVSVMCYSVTHDVTSSQPRQRTARARATPTSTPPATCILDVGWRRTTLTEVARRAGVSRMTIYRTWPDMPQLLGDLMTREWGGVVDDARSPARTPSATRCDRLVDGIVGTVARAARQRAVRADRRARPRAAPPLPARPPRPLAGR